MPASPCRISTSTVQKTDPFSTIKAINRSELTKGAKILYSQLRVSAGPKGFVFYRVHRLAEDTNSSISSTKEYIQELRAVGLVIPEHRPGRSNVWHVYDPDPTWDGKVPESPTQPVDRPGGSRWTDGGSAGPPAPLKNVLQNVRTKRSTFPPDEEILVRVPEAEVQDDWNDKNVGKSWLEKGEEDQISESEVRATVTTCTSGDDAKHRATQYSSAVCDDQPHPVNVTALVGDPGNPAPDPETVEEKSADSGYRDRGHHGDRGDSPVRVPHDHRADARIRKIFDTTLLTEILEVTGDYKSRGCWISVLSQVDEDSIRYGLSCLRQAEVDGTMIERPGAYLLKILRANNDIRFGSKTRRSNRGASQGTRTSDDVPPPAYAPGDQVSTTPPRPTVFTPSAPPEPEPPAPSIEELVKGWRFASRSISIPRLLEIMKTSVGEVLDPSTLWNEVKDLCTGLDQRTLLDRFLQVVTTRLRHKAAQTVV